jgi:glycosyltransferase involved in cell wall biosynthesis
MKKALSISIVIPAYNESRHLDGCLKAIGLQKVMPDEVIVVDNNSTDDTAQIAKRFPFVKVLKEKKQGIVYARDCGFNYAKTDIIARIDADSLVPENWIETIKKFYEIPEHENYAWTSIGYFYNINFHKANSWVSSQIVFRFNRILLGHYALWGSTMAITRKQWLMVKDQTCNRRDIHEDLDIAIHLHQHGVKITYDTSVKVAVVMRRVLSEQSSLWSYMMLWPRTLRVHQRKAWLLGMVGAVLVWAGSPLLRINKSTELKWKDLVNYLGLSSRP